MNKIRSFTVLELMVVMVISTLVLAVTYQGFMLFYKQFLSFNKRSEIIANISLADRLLNSDITNSKSVFKKANGIDCIYNDKVIHYEFNEQYIIRKDRLLSDTFDVAVSDFAINFLTKSSNDGGLVDEVVLHSMGKDQERTFCYSKKYGADILLNNVK